MPRIRAGTIEEHKERSRSEILAAAETMLVTRGYAKTQLGDVADAAGIGRSTLYQYFENKDELVVALVESRIPPALEEITAALNPGNSRSERLCYLFEHAVRYAGRRPDLATLVFRVGRKLPRAHQDRMWATLAPALLAIAHECAQGIAEEEFSAADPDLTGRIVADHFVDAIDEVVRDPDPAGRVDVVLDHWLPFLLRGLGSRVPERVSSTRVEP